LNLEVSTSTTSRRLGVGWNLALACDLIVATEDASFSAPVVQRGLVPDGGAAWFLMRALGRPRAAELLLLGDRLTARSAAGLGLVNRLTPAGAALTEAIELAGGLARGAPDALVLTKTLLGAAMDSTFERYLETEWLSAAPDLLGPDAAEGRAAFVEKRPPDFRRGHL